MTCSNMRVPGTIGENQTQEVWVTDYAGLKEAKGGATARVCI